MKRTILVTTRFSLSELADMLHAPVHIVRTAVDELAKSGELTAESFVFAERNWRVAPSDVKRIQSWIEAAVSSGRISLQREASRVIKKRIVASEPKSES